MKRLLVFVLPIFALLAMSVWSNAFARPAYVNQFKEVYLVKYPLATNIAKCTLCHGKGMVRNQYAIDFATAKYDFVAIEELDSDGDGVSNINEIAEGKYPGDPVVVSE